MKELLFFRMDFFGFELSWRRAFIAIGFVSSKVSRVIVSVLPSSPSLLSETTLTSFFFCSGSSSSSHQLDNTGQYNHKQNGQ